MIVLAGDDSIRTTWQQTRAQLADLGSQSDSAARPGKQSSQPHTTSNELNEELRILEITTHCTHRISQVQLHSVLGIIQTTDHRPQTSRTPPTPTATARRSRRAKTSDAKTQRKSKKAGHKARGPGEAGPASETGFVLGFCQRDLISRVRCLLPEQANRCRSWEHLTASPILRGPRG
jgi:hypothetical protein